jgi:RNA polymerase sigma factor for flagellar operon FliA
MFAFYSLVVLLVHFPGLLDIMTPVPTQTSNSEAIRDRLILDHLPLVRAIAIRVYENLPVHVDLDDLIHAGILGLFDAAARYDGDKQVTFKSYAKHRIKGAMLDSLRDLDWASRDLRKRHRKLEEITRELSSVMERNPTEQEIADKMGMDLERWRQVAIELRMVGLLSASSRPADSENQSAPEFPATDDLNPDVLTGKRQLNAVLGAAMGTLPDRHRTVIELYYSGEKTMREIGDTLGINESRVSQIHRAALDRMARSLQSAGIHSSASVL